MSVQRQRLSAEERSQVCQANARKAQCPACGKLMAMHNYPGLRRCIRCGFEEPKLNAKITKGRSNRIEEKESNLTIVVTAPETTEAQGYKVFLAGAIDMGQAVDWQAEVIKQLDGFNTLILYNPRRVAFTADTLDEQIHWELEALEQADAILMWLPANAKAPVSFLEAGFYWRSGKLHLGAEPGFYRRRNLELMAVRYGITLYDSLESLLSSVVPTFHWGGFEAAASPYQTKRLMIRGCARCGNDHDVEFRHFKGDSFVDAEGVIYDWWGACPITGDPVLMTNKHPELVDPEADSELPSKPESEPQ